jgi:hypothetical protein
MRDSVLNFTNYPSSSSSKTDIYYDYSAIFSALQDCCSFKQPSILLFGLLKVFDWKFADWDTFSR